MQAYVGETFYKRLIVFYIPLFLFVAAMLFPFYWMLITSIKPDFELYNVRRSPFIVAQATLEHWFYLFKETMFVRWAWNTLWIATASTAIFPFRRRVGRLFPVASALPGIHYLRHFDFRHLPGAAHLAVHPAGLGRCQPAAA